MRRIRRLESCDYLIHLGQKTPQLITSSNHSNVLIERTWHRQSRRDYELDIHVKFNADIMDGIQIKAQLLKEQRVSAMSIVSTNLFRVNEASWVETLVDSPTLTMALGVFTGTVSQSTLLLNELSGMETYALEVTALRKRRTFKKKVYFNHLGCFDSILRLQKEIEYFQITKLDE
ncbi:MAG: hypothetical protein BWY19_00808 [bacterium ADurb.Bin212]|nr:MAG: hypothetical protein BWY19_00808 [bacterium ADurb.Bin212]